MIINYLINRCLNKMIYEKKFSICVDREQTVLQLVNEYTWNQKNKEYIEYRTYLFTEEVCMLTLKNMHFSWTYCMFNCSLIFCFSKCYLQMLPIFTGEHMNVS